MPVAKGGKGGQDEQNLQSSLEQSAVRAAAGRVPDGGVQYAGGVGGRQ